MDIAQFLRALQGPVKPPPNSVMDWWVRNQLPTRQPGETRRQYDRRIRREWRSFCRQNDLTLRGTARSGTGVYIPGANKPAGTRSVDNPDRVPEWLRARQVERIFGRDGLDPKTGLAKTPAELRKLDRQRAANLREKLRQARQEGAARASGGRRGGGRRTRGNK
jgi:hypothetical protein